MSSPFFDILICFAAQRLVISPGFAFPAFVLLSPETPPSIVSNQPKSLGFSFGGFPPPFLHNREGGDHHDVRPQDTFPGALGAEHR